MLKERQQIVREIVRRLEPAERHIDEALASVAALNSHLPLARRASGLAIEVGDEALASFGEAQALMVQAYFKMVAGHRQLATLQERLRFPRLANGGLGDKDTTPNSPFAFPDGTEALAAPNRHQAHLDGLTRQ